MNYAHRNGHNSMPIDETINKRMVLVVDRPTAEAIEQLAKKDRRSVSNYVRNVLQDHVAGAADVDSEEPAVASEQVSDQQVYSQIIAAAVEKLKGDKG